ncbi:peptidase family C54-domain-containing protein [Fomitopsis serialis]|uniref:peptidase family C54-domain-containing protein n=1 Tax=Fomitopsis serialis TaxID=139415 RepID=UPI002008CC66|nr:peptidase family C54-domain-containing protein [Neoantrodia serialis]KAH9931302.1 peptidase family C54-domain-containing protein [Neoantrodia serialis]
MASKQKSLSPSSSSPGAATKLPRFFQKSGRDRSKSVADTAASTASTSSSSSSSPPPAPDVPKARKSFKKVLSPTKDRDEKRRASHDTDSIDRVEPETPADEPPVIVEPVNIPRPRTRSDRPSADPSNTYPQVYYPSSASAARLTDLPTRLSGWFSHTFSSSSTDLSLPSLLSQQQLAAATTSPRGKSSALLTAARHGKGHLDKAMRYLLDSDALPDKCSDPIWILGVEHPGYEPNPPPTASASALSASAGAGVARRGSADSRRSPSSLRSSTSSAPATPQDLSPFDASFSSAQLTPSSPTSGNNVKDPSKNWPPVFYADFTSRIWLTYRSQFQPIRDTTLSALETEVGEYAAPTGSPQPKRWNWPLGGEKGWTSDAGWGCMLRTGQSLLANALLHLHLGRDWRRPPYPIYTVDYATYVQIITWFLDHPSPLAPFSVHRMALVGKELGKDVGQWFGPSTAAGAIKTLVHTFPEANLGVSVAADGGVVYQSDVYAVSHSTMGSPRRHARLGWGDRGVLILIGIRLGLDGVNPVYYDTVKALYTFPQSVGIAGGRPSSSYYFVGSQADNLFYLDPHHARPAVPLRPPPIFGDTPASSIDGHPERATSPDNSYSSDRERERDRPRKSHHFRSPTTPTSVRVSSGSGGSTFSHRSSPATPSPLQQQLSTSSSSAASQSSSSQSHARWQSSPNIPDDSDMDMRELGADLDPIQRHYVTAYSASELKTFHCDRVRKMPLSGLDPSMLIGFLVKDEHDWLDFRSRVAELAKTHKQIFYIHDEPPSWPSDPDDSIGLESISEPDIDMPEDDDGDFSDGVRSPSASPDTSVQGVGSKSEADTEDDPIGPVTPGPGTAKSSFDIPQHEVMAKSKSSSVDEPIDFDDEEDEEWLDPAPYPEGDSEPTPAVVRAEQQVHAPAMKTSLSTSSTMSTSTNGSKKRKKTKKGSREKQVPVPVPMPPVQFPFPATNPDDEGSPREVEDFEERERVSTETGSKRVPQMRTAKARDGGRTQSGGVRGVPADDFDDF